MQADGGGEIRRQGQAVMGDADQVDVRSATKKDVQNRVATGGRSTQRDNV